MKKTCFVQLSDESTFWWSSSNRSAVQGFQTLGYNVQGFHSKDLEQHLLGTKLKKTTPVRGTVRSVRKALDLLGVPQPKNFDIPRKLKPFAGREIWASTLGEIREQNATVFIKPLHKQKDFNGHIIFKHESWRTVSLPDDYKILAQEVVSWEKEWRIYILRGTVVGIEQYCWGLGEAQPDITQINKMIRALGKTAPAAFCLDVGNIRQKEGTFLVEMNDGFSMGNYGIPHVTFAQMIEARWKELVKA